MASQPKKDAPIADIAGQAIDHARRAGAAEAAAMVSRSRDVSVSWRDGKIESLTEAGRRSLAIDVYVDGRYASVSTSDLRPDAVAAFVQGTVALTRTIQPDKDRRLPDPELYQGRATVDLQLEDPAQGEITPDQRKRYVEAAEAAARALPGAESFLSVTTASSDGWGETELVSSNGLQGSRRATYHSAYTGVTVKDSDGRRPEDGMYAMSRFRADLPSAEEVGREAARRALGRLGSVKGKSAVLPAVVENRVAGRLVFMLAGPLGGEALQQKRSCLEGKVGKAIASKRLTIFDDPLIPRGLGSRTFDNEGLALKRRPIVENGVLRDTYLDTYYARKLGMAPTSATITNLDWKLGDKDLAGLVTSAGEGIMITSFIGGNSNEATGDFSLGVRGVRIRGGKLAEPLGEMNVSGNLLDLWQRLADVGKDPWRWSTARTPSLLFDGIQFAGV